MIDIEKLKQETAIIVEDILERSAIKKGQIFVLGLSSSEVMGSHIGTASNVDIGEAIVSVILEKTKVCGIDLAVQGCEHLNRALVVESDVAERYQLEVVNVLPSLHAGGSGQLAAFKYMKNPVEVEEVIAHAGLDIGDTSIGMHIKRVQVPLRPLQRELGGAHLTALTSRPKLIGGDRALHQKDEIRKQ